jgi:hypothetical protein
MCNIQVKYVYRIKRWPRRCGHTPGPGPQKGWHSTVDTKESSVFRPSEACEDHHPHACYDGVVFFEKIEAIPCRCCCEEGGGYVED